MGPPHDDYNDNAERITLHESTPDSRQYEQDTEQVHEPSAAQPVVEGGNDVDDGDVRVSMATDDDNNDNRQETTTPEEAPLLSRSYSQDSVVSTDSAPPPYQFYPPAKTFFGRAYNWLRHIPRLRSHQAIALPTLPIRRPRYTRMDSLSSASIDSFASSAYPATCCSYAYYSIASRCPTLPRVVLPSFLARFRGLMICLSIFALLIFSILLFCAVFFAPASVTPGPFPDKSTDFTARMLTANIFMRPPGVTNNWSDFKDERLDYIVKYVLPDYDIVAFQEVFGFASRRKDRLIQQARNMGYNYHVESPRHYPWEFAADGGLLILSRFPILASNTIEYPRGIHSDWLSRKGALHALIQLNSTRYMHLYTTHAQASYTGTAEPSQTDVQVRMAQFSLLHQFIRDTAQNDNIPIVLMGDFNVDAAVHQGHPQTEPSKESSREYKMMMDVLNGRGVDVSSFYKMEKEVDDGQQVDNIDGGNGGTNVKYMTRRLYEDPQYSLVLADAVYETYHYHPVTYGDVVMGEDGQLEPAETVLTDQDQAMSVQSIDRIFWDKSRSAETLQVKDAQVEKFLVRNNDQLTKEEKEMIPFTQISDHYGLSCIIELS